MDKGPKIDPEKARQMQAGATESGWQPERWKTNLYEGLGFSKTAEAAPAPSPKTNQYQKLKK